MPEFKYYPPLPLGPDPTKYRLITQEGVSTAAFEGQRVVKVKSTVLTEIARQALSEVNYLYRTRHLESLRRILDDPESSDNDRYVAFTLLKNAVIAADRVLPSCQDTGTGVVFGKKGQQVWTEGNDEEAFSRGIFQTYEAENLRYSQMAPLSMYEEKNTGTNLPAQIDISAVEGEEYKLLFLAKGGGSANKMFLFQETRAILNPTALPKYIASKLGALGTAACPPYHLALVIGGTSAEATLKTLKLASAGYLDQLPTSGNEGGSAFRDLALEAEVIQLAQRSGIGAQFGGKYFAHDARVIRLPRHGASLPIGLGVSCSADRNILAKITHEGAFIEELDRDPARFLPAPETLHEGEVVAVDLNRPMDEIRAQLSQYPIRTRLALTGKLIVARDIAHARIREMAEAGEPVPDWFKAHPVYYAGPAKTPRGLPSGSFGPTTAGRMDSYVDFFQSRGASMIMLAKGNRSKQVTEACKKHGGFYLGSIGGPAAQLAHDHIKNVKPIAFPELGMEAVWQIEVKDFPAFIVVDDKGNDFFAKLM
jgi:fumarate hydratase class I